jgi:cytochrome oxidase assembly protein ShyY1
VFSIRHALFATRDTVRFSLPTDAGVRPLLIRGSVEPGREVHVTPRTPPQGTPPRYLPPDTGSAGYLAVTPLERPDGSFVLWIRGWYPKDGQLLQHQAAGEGAAGAPAQRREAAVAAGILRASEEPGTWAVKVRGREGAARGIGGSDRSGWRPSASSAHPCPLPPAPVALQHYPERDEFSWLDGPSIARHFGLPEDTPFFEAVQPLPAPGEPPFPLTRTAAALAETTIMPYKHLTYSVTWFALAVFGAIMTRRRFALPAAGTAGGRRQRGR